MNQGKKEKLNRKNIRQLGKEAQLSLQKLTEVTLEYALQ
jgi:hypothetical protein